MIQQKQQKNTRTQNARYKDQGKIGYLAKISNLPPIQTRSSSRSKFHQSIDKNSSHKKHKISDIFYEEIASKKPQHPKMNSTIIQKDSILQYSSRCEQEDKQQTVMKIHEKRKNSQNQYELCHFHQNKVKNEVQNGQASQITSSRMRVHQCCETQPSESHFHRNIRLNMFFNRNMQSRQKLKNSFLKTPEKLKPIKFNRYQKPQLFENKSAKHISSEKISNFKLSLSPVQAKIISDKLSQPKCTSNCGKKNCQCFSESQLKKINAFQRNNIHVMSEKQMALKKININIKRLKNIQNQENAEKQDQQNFNNLRRKINQKKTWRKNMKLKQIKRFDTEVLENDKFFQESIMNQNKTQQKDLSESQMSQESGTFLKGALSPVKKILSKSHFSQSEARLNKDFTNKVNILKKYHTIGNETQQQGKQRKNSDPVQKHVRQEITSGSRTTEKKIIDIQNNDSQNIPSGIKNFIKKSQKQQVTLQKDGNSVFSIGHSKIGTIGYTFGNSKESENSESINFNQEIVDKKKVQKKTKQQKIPSLKQTIQYWIRFDIQRNIFVDNFQTKEKRTSQKKEKQNINLISAVVKETIQVKKQLQSKPIRQSQSTNTHEGSHILVSSTIQPMPQAPIPVTIQMQSPEKSQIQLESRILGKIRNCNSSTSNKHSINMFNRSPKSLTSTKSKQYFKVPKEQECVQFVKNYKPSNPEIVMSQLVQKQGFKVLQGKGKVYFGEVIEQNIKHGLGVDLSSNEIFQGLYENGNRKNGFLKQHDGIYQGPFQNNLRHGYGTFRWNDGQIFKGQWRMGTKNGYGVWTGTDGSYYEGQWHLSMQHGKGKFVHFTSTYEGEFKNFFKEGFGKQTFPNGDIFTGEYKNGKPNGKGKYEWKDGTYYEGDFLQGLRDGFGKWHQNSHSFYEGQFKQDNKHGKGVEYFKDGSFLQGIFADGKISKGVHYNSRRQVIKQYSQIEQKC